MCNPPFYESLQELVESAKTKQKPPFSVSNEFVSASKAARKGTPKILIMPYEQACTGAEVEMVTPGGEVAFVSKMIKESLQLRETVQWYTSMVGKLSSLSAIIEILLQERNNNWAVTEFIQGTKTRRWAIAWSWKDLRPAMV